MTSIEGLKDEIESIKRRNRSVEADKAWELSKTRRFLISIFTYLSIALYLRAINISKPFLNAIVPTVAFLLSTLTLPSLKKIWLNYIYNKESEEKR